MDKAGYLFDYKLSAEEEKLVRKVKNLAREWGYRAGPGSEHTLYERKLHTHEYKEAYTITSITDPLFRTLQQGNAYCSDLTGKFYFPTILQDDAETRVLVRNLFLSFLESKKDVQSQMEELASAPLTCRSTWWFRVLGTSAQIFLLVSEGEFSKARSLASSFRKRLDEQIEEESCPQSER